MFEQTFKNIDDILHKDAGCGSELDYVEQTFYRIPGTSVQSKSSLISDKKTVEEG
jgi:type I restriction enzyme M protein